MKILSEKIDLATYGIPPIHPPGTQPAPPAIEPYPVAPNCKRVCRRYPKDINLNINLDPDPILSQGGQNGDEYYWLCEWECVGDQLNPWKITMNAIETLASKVQQQSADAFTWVQQALLPTIYETILLPWKTNWEGFITDTLNNVGSWLQQNITDKIPQAGAIQNWVTDTLLPAIKQNIENLETPIQKIRFLFPLWQPP